MSFRIMTSFLRLLLAAVILVSAGWLAPVIAAPDDDDDWPEPTLEEGAQRDSSPLPNLAQEFDQLVLGAKGPTAATAARRRLYEVMVKRMNALDRICGLSTDQKQKLRLAALGDIKRLFDRLDDQRRKFQAARSHRDYNDVVRATSTEVGVLRALLKSGPFGDQSLFAKVRKAVLSPEQLEKYDGRSRLAARSTKKITVDNARDLASAARFRRDVYRLVYNRDGSQVGLLEFGKPLEIHSADDFRALRTIGAGRELVSFDFSLDDVNVAIAENSTKAFLVNLATGDEQLLETKQPQPSVKFSPNGKFLATGGYGTSATLWSVETGERLMDVDAGPEGGLTPVFSPDSSILAVGNRNAATRLFDVASGRLLNELPLRSSHELTFDHSGKRLAVVYVDGSLAVWNVATGKLIKRVAAKANELYSVDWSPDGKILATAGLNASVTLRNATDLAVLTELECPEWVICVRFNPQGTRLVFTGGSTVASPERYVETWAVP
jgi:hypothetical protein